MSIGEWFQVKKLLAQERLREFFLCDLKNGRFALVDLFFLFASLFFNPYRTARKFGKKAGFPFEPYGETPLRTVQRIADFCSLTSADSWLELGSGRGRSCFWLAEWIGCKVVGVERVPLFFYVSRFIASLLRFRNASFQKGDFSKADFSTATCVYLYSTCLSDEALVKLADKMQELPKSARVATVSAPLPPRDFLLLEGSFPVSFPWGTTEAYLHKKIN